MSQQSSNNKKPAGVYEALLFVSLTSLIIGCSLLALKLSEYQWQVSP